jgi:hypothetical protein
MFKIFCTYICWIIYKMQHLDVSGAVRHIYIYIYIYICVCVSVVRQLRVNFLEPSGPLQAYNGTALPLTLHGVKEVMPSVTNHIINGHIWSYEQRTAISVQLQTKREEQRQGKPPAGRRQAADGHVHVTLPLLWAATQNVPAGCGYSVRHPGKFRSVKEWNRFAVCAEQNTNQVSPTQSALQFEQHKT